MVRRDEIVAWRERWREVNAVTEAEARSASPADRLQALARLYAFGRFTDASLRQRDERAVWDRFQQLRVIHRDRLARR